MHRNARRASLARAVVMAAIVAPLVGCLSSPKAEAIRQQQMIEMGDAVNEIRIATAELNSTLDSLRIVVARQDTTIARLANVTGVVVVK
jgi:ABC-type uncharacterized transport system auxiliary subunit